MHCLFSPSLFPSPSSSLSYSGTYGCLNARGLLGAIIPTGKAHIYRWCLRNESGQEDSPLTTAASVTLLSKLLGDIVSIYEMLLQLAHTVGECIPTTSSTHAFSCLTSYLCQFVFQSTNALYGCYFMYALVDCAADLAAISRIL